jgi:Flp pilus assembly protein CpaB
LAKLKSRIAERRHSVVINLKSRKKEIGIVLATSAVWIGIIGATFYITGSVPSLKGKYVYSVKAAKNITAGSIVKQSDLKIVKDSIYNKVPTSYGYNETKSIVGKIADRNIYKNENIKKDDISESTNNLRPCTLPVSLDTLSDNSIASGDYVDVIVNYKEKGRKPDIIVAKALVSKVVDSTGEPMSAQKTSDQKQIPAHLTVLVNNSDILSIEDAKKIASFSFYKYLSQSTAASKVTYIPSWDKPVPSPAQQSVESTAQK